MRSSIFLLFVVSMLAPRWARAQQGPECVRPVFLQEPTPWADSLVHTLTLDQKIGQLFMVAAWSDPKHQSYDKAGMELLIRKYGIGGVIFFQGSPVRQAKLTNDFQRASTIPLMIGMDAEWGLGMRLDSTISYPRQMTLGAVQDETLIYGYGREMARQLKRLGVHVSFSPVVDINNNPDNPVISNRSFGENRERVTRYSYQYMKGLQDGGILANAKHFPGHGDTDADSHKSLPVIPYDMERLDSLELYPYRKLFNEGLSSVMIAHLYVPAIDSTPNVATTLSRPVVTGLLRERMGFEGLVFTDALNMQGVAGYYPPGETDLRALMAGNDVLLYPLNVAKAIEQIKAAVANGLITEDEITEHCLRILRAKEWAGLNEWKPIDTRNLVADLNAPEAQALQRRITESSVTVLRNNCSLAPLCQADAGRVAVVSIGTGSDNEFTRTLRQYAAFDVFSMDKNPSFDESIRMHDTLATYDLVIAAMMNTSNKASKNFGVSNEAARILNAVGEKTNVLLSVFANPYSFNTLRDLGNIETIIVSYQDDALTRQVTAEVLVGACTADGRLPVTTSTYFSSGEGIPLRQQTRLRWVSPEYLGICAVGSDQGAVRYDHRKDDTGQTGGGAYREDMMADRNSGQVRVESDCFRAVDSLAMWGIQQGAYPGCRVLAAVDGHVVYDRSFGHLDYERSAKVNSQTVYDLASITKVVSSTLAIMKLTDEGLVHPDSTIGHYLDEVPEESPFHGVTLRRMLTHSAGFKAWIPFYTRTMQDGRPDPALYRTAAEEGFTKQVADGLFIRDDYRDSIVGQILDSGVDAGQGYLYSDLGYYFLERIIRKQTGLPLDQYVMETFYRPMGLESMGYNPLQRMPLSRIAPTENDKVWRRQVVRGHVHDQGAAMMGGVAGHAGVFSTAQDLAAVMQMLLNEGSYGGVRFIRPETVRMFTSTQYPGNRRGLGFDKPASPGSGPTCPEASPGSFGHTGFTGTMCWVDPENGMVYVFLSNRVYPDAENKKLQNLDIRTKIQQELYRIIGPAR